MKILGKLNFIYLRASCSVVIDFAETSPAPDHINSLWQLRPRFENDKAYNTNVGIVAEN